MNSIFLYPGMGSFGPGGSFSPSGPTLAPDGTIALPAYSFANEPSSGWYRGAAGDVRLSVLGVNRIVANPTSTAINGPDGGAYFGIFNGFAQVNSAYINMASSGVSRVRIGAPADAILRFSNSADSAGVAIEGLEQTAPSAAPANGYRLFAQDNGGGKTQLMVIFNTGVAQQIAIQP